MLRAKISLHIWSTVFLRPSYDKRKILGTPSFDIDLPLILQRRLSTSTYDSKICSITSSIFGCIRRSSDETMFSLFCFLFSLFWASSGVLGAVLEGGRIIALALLRLAKYGVVKRLSLGDFDGWLVVTCRTTAERNEADDRLKF